MYPILLLVVLLVVFFVIKPNVYYSLKSIYGSQLQWFGYEEIGNRIIANSFSKMDGMIPSHIYHASSVQNTKNGNYDEAIAYLNKAISMSPMDGDGYMGWVLLYYYRDYERALLYLNRLEASTMENTKYVSDDHILYAKGLCHKQLEDYESALDLFSRAIEDELKNQDGILITHQMYFQKGRTLDLLDRPDEAIVFYDKAIDKWSGSSESLFYKGLAQIKLGATEKGCSNLKSARNQVVKGIKSADSYVRLFDEVYQFQIEEAIERLCL